MTGWHLKKEVSIGHLLMTISIIGALLLAWFNLKEQTGSNTERGQRNEKMIQTLMIVDTKHAELPIHPGAGEEVARISAEIRALTRQVTGMDNRMQRQWDEFNRELRRRNPE